MDWIKQLTAADGYRELGMHEEAVRALDEIAPNDQSRKEVMAFRIALAMAASAWVRGADLSARMVQAEPDEPMWWIDYAYCVRRSISLEEAEKILLRAITIHPHSALIRYNLACYASVTGRLVEARHRLEEAQALDAGMRALAIADDDLRPLHAFLARED